MKDFFVSYNSADKAWAEWIAWTLEEAGYSVVIQAWDFRPGGNFVLEMQKAAQGTERTLVVLSENYLKADYTQPEWAAALVDDPRGEKRKLFPVRVGACSPDGMLKPMIYADLVGLDASEAKEVLLSALQERAKPAQTPPFPGANAGPTSSSGRAMPRAVAYPKQPQANPKQPQAKVGSSALSLWREKLEFLREQEALAVDASQKFALRKQIEEAESKIRELGG